MEFMTSVCRRLVERITLVDHIEVVHLFICSRATPVLGFTQTEVNISLGNKNCIIYPTLAFLSPGRILLGILEILVSR